MHIYIILKQLVNTVIHMYVETAVFGRNLLIPLQLAACVFVSHLALCLHCHLLFPYYAFANYTNAFWVNVSRR